MKNITIYLGGSYIAIILDYNDDDGYDRTHEAFWLMHN